MSLHPHQQDKKPYTEMWTCPKCGLEKEVTYKWSGKAWVAYLGHPEEECV